MMKSIERRAAELAEIRQSMIVRRVTAVVRDEMPDASCEEGSGNLVLTGRHLLKGWLENSTLRNLRGSIR